MPTQKTDRIAMMSRIEVVYELAKHCRWEHYNEVLKWPTPMLKALLNYYEQDRTNYRAVPAIMPARHHSRPMLFGAGGPQQHQGFTVEELKRMWDRFEDKVRDDLASRGHGGYHNEDGYLIVEVKI